MALVTNITKKIEIPNETETAVIRKLSHIQLKLAAKAKQSEGVDFMRQMGGELLKALKDSDTTAIKKIQEAQEADINNYDRYMLLRFGIASWSYPVKPVADPNPAFEDGKINPADGIYQQDEETAKFIAEQIFEFSRPDSKVELKNV